MGFWLLWTVLSLASAFVLLTWGRKVAYDPANSIRMPAAERERMAVIFGLLFAASGITGIIVMIVQLS